MKRLFDIVCSFFGLAILSPALVLFIVLIWLEDHHSPLYIALRMKSKREVFKMIKLRSMVIDADKLGGSSTANSDNRITWAGKVIRKYKLDELSQLLNVLKGDMSLVGPRPQVKQDADLYTQEEWRILSVRPGITDIASIVFADEGDILKGSEDPDLAYNQLIRPWKSRLGLYYVDHASLWLDIQLIFITLIGIFSRPTALRAVQRVLRKSGADDQLIMVASRETKLQPAAPPGANQIVEVLPNR